jgi:hypothetical protein
MANQPAQSASRSRWVGQQLFHMNGQRVHFAFDEAKRSVDQLEISNLRKFSVRLRSTRMESPRKKVVGSARVDATARWEAAWWSAIGKSRERASQAPRLRQIRFGELPTSPNPRLTVGTLSGRVYVSCTLPTGKANRRRRTNVSSRSRHVTATYHAPHTRCVTCHASRERTRGIREPTDRARAGLRPFCRRSRRGRQGARGRPGVVDCAARYPNEAPKIPGLQVRVIKSRGYDP